MSLSEGAAEVGLARPTARRFLIMLQHVGYVFADAENRSLAPRVLESGGSFLEALGLIAVGDRTVPMTRHSLGLSNTPGVHDLPPPELDEHGEALRASLSHPESGAA